jgi:transposase
MNLKVILNAVHPISPFVYGTPAFIDPDKKEQGIVVPVAARANSKAVCSRCGTRGGIYDTSREPRRFEFIPLWGLPVFLEYTMRRVNCRGCNTPVIEKVPWAEGKNQTCNAYQLFLARWAKRMAWSEVAEVFGTSWGVVYRAVASVVAWGLAVRRLDNVRAIGVDEIAVRKGQHYLTVVYQLDEGVRRLLWVGKERTEKTFEGFFEMLGEEQSKALDYIASDMWKPYLKVIAKHAAQAVHVLDRFHIVANVSKAVDDVRAEEAKSLARNGYEPVLKKTRWCFLKRPENLTPVQSTKLADVLFCPSRKASSPTRVVGPEHGNHSGREEATTALERAEGRHPARGAGREEAGVGRVRGAQAPAEPLLLLAEAVLRERHGGLRARRQRGEARA